MASLISRWKKPILTAAPFRWRQRVSHFIWAFMWARTSPSTHWSTNMMQSSCPAVPRNPVICQSRVAILRACILRWSSCHSKTVVCLQEPQDAEPILAGGKHVVVIGGGDTGSDCIGTSIRQGALSVTQLEIMPTPPDSEDKLLTWPNWPLKMRTSSSQEEGADREFSVMTQRFDGIDGQVKALHCIRVDEKFQPVAGSEFVLRADLALLAMGFVSPITEGMIADLGVELDRPPECSCRHDRLQNQP